MFSPVRPHAARLGESRRVEPQEGEFEKRAAFALLWSLALHDKRANDGQFVAGLELIERAGDDDRKFVKKR